METTHTRLAKDGSLRVFFFFALILLLIKYFGDINSLVKGIPLVEQMAEQGIVVGIAIFPSAVAYAIIWSLSWLLRKR